MLKQGKGLEDWGSPNFKENILFTVNSKNVEVYFTV